MSHYYIGHRSQLHRVEEHRLVGGKGDGIRLLEVDNGMGLFMTLSIDKCMDISRLSVKGLNLGYFAPSGYAHPTYYEAEGGKFLKSAPFGFLTTCGLENVGVENIDQGERLPVHGSISNIPAEYVRHSVENDRIIIEAEMNDEVLFGRKLRLHRTFNVSLTSNTFTIQDRIVNTGDQVEPVTLLYHLNMGYPLLDEESIIEIPSDHVKARDAHASTGLSKWNQVQVPTAGYQEMCFYHTFTERGEASIYQPKHDTKVLIQWDPTLLDCFTQWKMMGIRDYVMGLECGNCYPDGRHVMRESGLLKELLPGEELLYEVKITVV